MVTKKSLKAQIDFLIDKIDKISDENINLEKQICWLDAEIKQLESKFEGFNEFSNQRQKNFSDIVTDLSEKVDFVYRKTDSMIVPTTSLFDEWMNGAQKEGEN